nr:hypothetical protein Q903MT_gene2391 [Picea sitchensis]
MPVFLLMGKIPWLNHHFYCLEECSRKLSRSKLLGMLGRMMIPGIRIMLLGLGLRLEMPLLLLFYNTYTFAWAWAWAGTVTAAYLDGTSSYADPYFHGTRV